MSREDGAGEGLLVEEGDFRGGGPRRESPGIWKAVETLSSPGNEKIGEPRDRRAPKAPKYPSRRATRRRGEGEGAEGARSIPGGGMRT